MITSIHWRGRPIEELSSIELRNALANAVSDTHFAKSQSSAENLFDLVLVAYVAGALSAAIGFVTGMALFR